MRVIITGAGQVGYNIATYLVKENNDVTIIDIDPKRVAQINTEMDVRGIVGHASNPEVLNAAGAHETDMIIAVTYSDEVNMTTCQVCHSLFNVPKKIARIRMQDYLLPEWSNLFSRAHMPIDVIVSPEKLVAQDIYERLHIPGTFLANAIADEKAYIIGVVCEASCPILETPAGHINDLFPNLTFKLLFLNRRGKIIRIAQDTNIQEGDKVFMIVKTDHITRTLAIFGHEEQEARRIVIAGGGNIGLGLTEILKEKEHGINITIIEYDHDRARFLGEELNDVLILNGDTLDQEILESARIELAETYISVTNNDEKNILGSLMAQKLGSPRTMSLVNNPSYSLLIGSLGIDSIVAPRSIVVSKILQHIRKGRIQGLHKLADGFVEVMEASVSENSGFVNKAIGNITLPPSARIIAVVHNDKFIFPDDDFIVRIDDLVVISAEQEDIGKVEKLFSSQIDIF